MIKVTYNIENNEKEAIILIDHSSINGMEAMEFTNTISTIDKDTKSVVIDIDNVSFIASPGIGMILNAHIILKRNEIALKIINAAENIKKLFVMTKIDHVIPVEYKKDAE
jgi:anti-anti-sigma factor